MRGTNRRLLAQVLVRTGFWPPNIEFGLDDLATVVDVMKDDSE